MHTQRFPSDRADEGLDFVAIGLGSNIGDRHAHLRYAARALEALPLLEPVYSAVYETAPMHVTDQADFLNACVVGWRSHDPEELLSELQGIERAAGRTSGGERYGPRVLDLDILLFGDRIVDQEGLRIPHPRLCERAFALVPLAEIAAEWVHPELQRSISELAAQSDKTGIQATNLRLESV